MVSQHRTNFLGGSNNKWNIFEVRSTELLKHNFCPTKKHTILHNTYLHFVLLLGWESLLRKEAGMRLPMPESDSVTVLLDTVARRWMGRFIGYDEGSLIEQAENDFLSHFWLDLKTFATLSLRAVPVGIACDPRSYWWCICLREDKPYVENFLNKLPGDSRGGKCHI